MDSRNQRVVALVVFEKPSLGSEQSALGSKLVCF